VRPIHDLSTEEAYLLAVDQLGEGLPPLDAVENEDWGRDYVLQRILMHDDTELSRVGIARP
jgi:hypothetical protein